MSQPSTTEPDLPELPEGWTARIPELDDLPALVALRIADQQPWTGATSVDEEAIESEIAGPASWTRRQLVAVDDDGTAARLDHGPRPRRRTRPRVRATSTAPSTWSTGSRTRSTPGPRDRRWRSPGCAASTRPGWTRARSRRTRSAAAMAGRGRLHQAAHLAAHGAAGHPRGGDSLPPPREGVTIRRVASHENGLPVAGRPAARPRDAGGVLRGPLQLLPGELPGVRAAAPRGPRSPLGPLVAGVRRGRRRRAAPRGRPGRAPCSPRTRTGHEGSYVEYIGVHRARSRSWRRQGAPAHA